MRDDSKIYAYESGKDSVLSGANMGNCHFRHFATPELREAWEQGAADARAFEARQREKI